MSAASNHLLRILAVFWARLGAARVFVAAVVGVVLVLAAVGSWHLIVPAKRAGVFPASAPASNSASSNDQAVARVAPGVQFSSPSAISASPSPVALERAIVITEVTETMRRGMRGEMLLAATIGMTSRSLAENGAIEIRVLFYDLNRNNEMRPTDAQVTYQWLTPIRDWTDPAPKYLEATYLQRRPFRRSPQHLRYGGFVVRIYRDGKLQDERSKPEALIAALRSNAAPPSIVDATTPVPPTPAGDVSTSPSKFTATKPPPSPTQPASPEQTRAIAENETNLPYGKPIPGKPGFVQSPYDPKFIIDVRGFPPGTLVNDPNTNKPFRIP